MKRYFTGKACPRGHVVERLISNRGCLECLRENATARRAANPDKIRAYNRRANGLPEPTRPCPKFCECCGKPTGKKAMCLDHDHITGEFRGWLCHKCNRAIGTLGDTVYGLLMAVAYLLRK